ncbi:Ferredoxin 7Fe [compost metagenome]
MAYVIAAPCIADYSCVEICPVNCISPGPHEKEFDGAEQMYINPDVCVNCGACRDVCPVLAIYEAGCLPEKWQHYAQINKEFFSTRSS